MSLALLSGGEEKGNEERIFSLLFKEDDLTWQSVIYDLVKTEAMDPWDIDVNLIAEKFLAMLRQMKDMDFRIGGKMVLAAALLLKIKSERLMKFDITALDNLINDDMPDLLDEIEDFSGAIDKNSFEKPNLIPRTPQPRQRKVSVYDLVDALEKALEVEAKKTYRKRNSEGPTVKVPEKKEDVTTMINSLFRSIKKSLSSSTIITFDSLIPSDSREDKVFTFIPLLHLDNQRKIELSQKEHFGQINIKLNKFSLDS